MLILTAGCGLALAFLLLRQRSFFQQQRHLLRDLDLARSNLNRASVRLLLSSTRDEPGEFRQACAELQQAVLEIRTGYRQHQHDPGAFESDVGEVSRWLARPHRMPLAGRDIQEGAACLRQLDLEAQRLHELSSLDFARGDAALGREISGILWLLAMAVSGSALLVLKLRREEGELASRLAESESQLTLLADSLPESYLFQYIHRPHGQSGFHYASAGFEHVHGISSAQLLHDCECLFVQFSDYQLQGHLKAEVHPPSSVCDINDDFTFRRPDGALRILSLRCQSRLLPDGAVLWNGLATDVTDNRRLEAKYRDLVENAFEGIYQTRPDGGLLAVNPSMARAFGYSSPQAMLENLKSAYDLYAFPSQREEFVRLLSRDGRVQDYEFQGRRQDGSRVWISTNARAVRNATGQVDYYEGTGLDITERKQAFERIRQLNRVHAVRTDINQAIVYGASPQQVFDCVCRATVEKGMFFSTAIALLGPELAIFATAGSALPEALLRAAGHCPVMGAALAGESSVENDLEKLDEAVAWKAQALNQGARSVAVLPIRSEEQICGLLVLFSQQSGFFDADEVGLLEELAADISFAISVQHREQKRLATEEELRVSQEHFRQAQKMEGIGQLAGGVAHDFNNILAVIIMETELILSSDELADEIREGLGEIRAGAERAANLTRQLLLFSRRQVMQRRELDLNEVVTQLVKMLQRIIGEDVTLELQLSSRPLNIYADAGMIEQVLLNLAVNSRDAMPAGGLLRITTEEKILGAQDLWQNREARPGPYCALTVKDSGGGMTPEVLERIFEPFYTTKEQGKGTGLGLATVFGIVKQHQGSIQVSSQPGQGSSFCICLPAIQTEPECQEKVDRAHQLELRGSERILLVEDDANLRRVTSLVLSAAGYGVCSASRGCEALALFEGQAQQTDLLLTDLVMPQQMSGLELAECCRRQKPDLPVIYMSGYSEMIAGLDLNLNLGELFLQKPFNPNQILQMVRQALDRHSVSLTPSCPHP